MLAQCSKANHRSQDTHSSICVTGMESREFGDCEVEAYKLVSESLEKLQQQAVWSMCWSLHWVLGHPKERFRWGCPSPLHAERLSSATWLSALGPTMVGWLLKLPLRLNFLEVQDFSSSGLTLPPCSHTSSPRAVSPSPLFWRQGPPIPFPPPFLPRPPLIIIFSDSTLDQFLCLFKFCWVVMFSKIFNKWIPKC